MWFFFIITYIYIIISGSGTWPLKKSPKCEISKSKLLIYDIGVLHFDVFSIGLNTKKRLRLVTPISKRPQTEYHPLEYREVTLFHLLRWK